MRRCYWLITFKEVLKETQDLIREKKFEWQVADDDFLFAALHCEVSEFFDAVKKGKPKEKQLEELADVILRITNLVTKMQGTDKDSIGQKFEKCATQNWVFKQQSLCKLAGDMHKLISSAYLYCAKFKAWTMEWDWAYYREDLKELIHTVFLTAKNVAPDEDLRTHIEAKILYNKNRPINFGTYKEGQE